MCAALFSHCHITITTTPQLMITATWLLLNSKDGNENIHQKPPPGLLQ
jgi:hypothetical protein